VAIRDDLRARHAVVGGTAREQIIGRSPALMEVLENVKRVAPTDTSVLITGETGSGKELTARAIHSTSKRKNQPLIKVNCAALSSDLVESELFGHEKGAFTGALAKRLGGFELANSGTIFIDEIGELPAETQVKLLRVLQDREFERVGSAVPIQADVRVIAATNRDLLGAVREEVFRQDLFYRLNVFPIRLPPLRERKEDIPLIVHFLAKKLAQRIGKQIDGVGAETMRRLQEYPWPGNIRELENVLERAVILATGSTLDIAIASNFVPAAQPAPSPVEQPNAPAESNAAPAAGQSPGLPQPRLEIVEREYILKILQQTNWLITGPRGAANILGLNPSTLRNRMKKLGISR
jgi:formate hydrogenlyase transcriptional activator